MDIGIEHRVRTEVEANGDDFVALVEAICFAVSDISFAEPTFADEDDGEPGLKHVVLEFTDNPLTKGFAAKSIRAVLDGFGQSYFSAIAGHPVQRLHSSLTALAI